MSTRLQVLMDTKELKQLQKIAKKMGIPLGEWVRRCLREAAHKLSVKPVAAKQKALQQAIQFTYPTADIDQMIDEINKGYL